MKRERSVSIVNVLRILPPLTKPKNRNGFRLRRDLGWACISPSPGYILYDTDTLIRAISLHGHTCLSRFHAPILSTRMPFFAEEWAILRVRGRPRALRTSIKSCRPPRRDIWVRPCAYQLMEISPEPGEFSASTPDGRVHACVLL